MAGSEAWPTIPTGNKDHLEAAVVIIGGGISGMCTAIDLIQRNKCKNFVILEKSGGVGGTWRDNKYPGCCCDGKLIYQQKDQANESSVVTFVQLLLRTELRLDERVPWARGDSGKQDRKPKRRS